MARGALVSLLFFAAFALGVFAVAVFGVAIPALVNSHDDFLTACSILAAVLAVIAVGWAAAGLWRLVCKLSGETEDTQ